MLQDARDLSEGQTLQADVCIVGAGVAGITIADRLRGSGRSVCVLESGGLERDPDIQRLYGGQMTGIDTWQLGVMRVRAFGGSSHHWSGWCLPLEPEDLAPRDWIPNSGWPIDYETLVPYYERAQQRLGLGGFDYDAARLGARTGRAPLETPAGRLTSGIIQLSEPATRFGDEYRDPLDASPDTRVFLHANATNIALDASRDRIQRIDCSTLEGKSFRVEASRYVLALGGIENARLLLASNGQLEAGVANSSGDVGRFFMEHPHYNVSAAWLVSSRTDLSLYRSHMVDIPVNGMSSRVPVLGYLSLSPQTLAEEGLLDMQVAITDRSLQDAETGRLDPPVLRTLLRGNRDQAQFVRLTPRVEQTPSAESRITLGGNRDALGMPRVRLNWQIRDEDRRQVRRALEIMGSELASAGAGRLWIPKEDGRLSWRPDSGGHHMGTTRMGAGPTDGVVDAQCRAFDVDNLYVAGSSVFRTSGKANPTLTIVALAERLADHLREES